MRSSLWVSSLRPWHNGLTFTQPKDLLPWTARRALPDLPDLIDFFETNRDTQNGAPWWSPFPKPFAALIHLRSLTHTYASELLKAHQASVGIHCSRVTIVQLAKIHWPRWTDDTRHIGRQISPNCNGTLSFKLKSPEKKQKVRVTHYHHDMQCVRVLPCECVDVLPKCVCGSSRWQLQRPAKDFMETPTSNIGRRQTTSLQLGIASTESRTGYICQLIKTDKTERIWKKMLFDAICTFASPRIHESYLASSAGSWFGQVAMARSTCKDRQQQQSLSSLIFNPCSTMFNPQSVIEGSRGRNVGVFDRRTQRLFTVVQIWN